MAFFRLKNPELMKVGSSLVLNFKIPVACALAETKQTTPDEVGE